MISIHLQNVGLNFAEEVTEKGDRIPIVIVVDQQSGIQVFIPFDPDAARVVAAHLDNRPAIQVASSLP